MRYRYLGDFRRGISVFAIFSYGIAVLGTPQCPPPYWPEKLLLLTSCTNWWEELNQTGAREKNKD